MNNKNDYVVNKIVVVCPECNSMFSTDVLVRLPFETPDSQVETTLEHHYSDAGLRSDNLAQCPFCKYCWWQTAFKRHRFQPEFLLPADKVSPVQKFMSAMLTGRKKHFKQIEVADMAINGYFCAKECGEEVDTWMKLAKRELEKALKGGIRPIDCNYTYILGELYRLSGNFLGAVSQYNKIAKESWIPKELIEQQKAAAIACDSSVIYLPSKMLEQMFCIPKVQDELKPSA